LKKLIVELWPASSICRARLETGRVVVSLGGNRGQ
jgi:hypothetical protein